VPGFHAHALEQLTGAALVLAAGSRRPAKLLQTPGEVVAFALQLPQVG
jgi:hypothetical protein